MHEAEYTQFELEINPIIEHKGFGRVKAYFGDSDCSRQEESIDPHISKKIDYQGFRAVLHEFNQTFRYANTNLPKCMQGFKPIIQRQ